MRSQLRQLASAVYGDLFLVVAPTTAANTASHPLQMIMHAAALRRARASPAAPVSGKLESEARPCFMLAMHVLATVFALLPRFWSWQGLVAFAVLYWTTVLGVTLGLHRLMAHRSFEVPSNGWSGCWW